MPRTVAYRAGGFTNCGISYTKFSQEELAEMKDRVAMTENEVIEELKYDCNELGKAIPCDTSWGKSFENAYAIAIKALEEVQQYRAIGTPEELRSMKENGAFTGMELAQLAAMQMRLKEYEKIGTPEVCRAAVEKQTETLTVDKAKTIAAKAICIGCGYLADCKCDYNGGNCMVSKPMLESVLKSFDDWNRRANDGGID